MVEVTVLYNLHKKACDLLAVLELREPRGSDVAALTFCCTIVSQIGDVLILIDQKSYNSIGVILRSIVEGYVDLKNLIQDPNYFEILQGRLISDQIEAVKKLLDGDLTDHDRDALIQKKGNLSSRYEEMGEPKWLHPEKKFKRAGEVGLYIFAYFQLCDDSHNSLKALEQRHILNDKERLQIVLHKPISDETKDAYFTTIQEILENTTEIMTSRFAGIGKENVNSGSEQREVTA